MKKQILGAAGILTAGLIAGSAFSITAAANAADETGSVASTNSVATTDTTTGAATDANRPDIFSPNSVKPGESLVTCDALTKVTDAPLAKYPGATVIRVENDEDGAEYEAHLKLADGSVVTVEFDSSFNITGDHEGFADASKGGPQGPHGDDDGPDDDGDGHAAGFQLQAPSTTQSN